ncbi:hypothetical protein K6U51_23680 [Vibrio fluvialis]|nr:hypothetical protein [Vibrio fluvialis]MCG6421030.1 hypothetical protein [Vibrio fluvialis]
MLSLRQFASHHGVSVSTAVSCYAELEAQGWLIARPHAGFFTAQQPPIAPPPSWPPFRSPVPTPTTIRQPHPPPLRPPRHLTPATGYPRPPGAGSQPAPRDETGRQQNNLLPGTSG